MSREELTNASQTLREAADRTTDDSLSDRLADQAEQLAGLAERERGPDHGRLDRHQQTLRELKAAADDATADRIDAANEHIVAYRETIEGV